MKFVRNYSRSPILSYYDLTLEQQTEIESIYGNDMDSQTEDSYVLFTNRKVEHALPLSMFMKCEGIFNGYYSLGLWDGYLIKISKSGDEATVVYQYQVN